MRMTLFVIASFCFHAVANAELIHVSATGTFGPNQDPANPIVASNETFSVSFDVTDPVPTVDFESASFSNLTYLLGGAPVSETAFDVQFYTDLSGGLFSLYFTGGYSLNFFGAQLFDTNGSLIPGTYDTYVPGGLFPDGAATVIVTAVPEPSSMALLCLGGIGIAVGKFRRRRLTA